jgi:steroid delta-isomerase-like uncharacterized protein
MKRTLVLVLGVVGLLIVTSLAPLSAQDEQDSYEDTMQAFLRLFNEGDVTVVEDTFAPDMVLHYLDGNPDLEGREALIGWVLSSRTMWPDLTVTIDEQIAQGNLYAARWTLTGTHSGDVPGIPATGNEVRFQGMLMLRIEDGKIVEWWHADDQLSILIQIGVIPPPEPPQ